MSHHSSYDPKDSADPTRKELSEAMKKVFGEYSNGRLNYHDEGGISVAIEHENGAVVLKFPKPVAWIGFTPEQAMEIASTLIRHARECGHSGILSVSL